VTAKSIAAAAIHVLEGAMTVDNKNRLEQGYGPASAVQGFVAYVAKSSEPGRQPVGEVWTFEFDGTWSTDPFEVVGFTDPDPCTAWPLTAVPARPSYQDPDVDGYGRLPADVIADHFQHRLRDFRASPLSEVRETIDQEMAALIASDIGPFIRHGVGGAWTLLELRAEARPLQHVRYWGPNGTAQPES